MAIEITVPRLGWSMDEGTFGEWLKADGEFVNADEPVFTLESEKALQEVESVDEGYLHILAGGAEEGDIVTVGTLLGYLLAEGEEPPDVTAGDRAAADEDVPSAESVVSAARVKTAAVASTQPSGVTPAISPRAARLAAQLGVDWAGLAGSGRTGRIREADIRAAAGAAPTAGRAAVSSVRGVIADRMMATVHSTAAVTLTTRVDATSLVALRQQYQESQTEHVPSYQDVVAKLTALALRQHPVMNSQWTDEGIVESDGIHIGLAVDTEAGLLVPVVRDVDQLSLGEVTQQSQSLIERARNRSCSPAELSGGTFSITNLGAFGVDFFTPILNSPQTAILGLGAIRREAVAEGDRIVAQDQLPLSLTFDHRITDGAPAARFLQTIAGMIENPGPWLIS
ncbi:MAG: 2-oxo acid dehydrogenase subunit E2 [Planctomycetes bacterium]|nr:2-oxo acid dehydrogenase subunit E2 [Planctomycetota bacterium]